MSLRHPKKPTRGFVCKPCRRGEHGKGTSPNCACRACPRAPPASRLRARVQRRVLAHAPRAAHQHPNDPAPLRYCACGEAIVLVAGVWWHLRRDSVPAHAAKARSVNA